MTLKQFLHLPAVVLLLGLALPVGLLMLILRLYFSLLSYEGKVYG